MGKFMVVDDEFLMTGSFNWTFQAGKSNQENLLVVDHPFYVKKYVQEFEKLWKQFDKNEVEGDQRRVHNNSRHNNRRNNNNNNKRRYNDGNDHDNKNNHNEGDQQQHHGRGGHTKKPNIVEQGK